jgi:hypothetical protein
MLSDAQQLTEDLGVEVGVVGKVARLTAEHGDMGVGQQVGGEATVDGGGPKAGEGAGRRVEAGAAVVEKEHNFGRVGAALPEANSLPSAHSQSPPGTTFLHFRSAGAVVVDGAVVATATASSSLPPHPATVAVNAARSRSSARIRERWPVTR